MLYCTRKGVAKRVPRISASVITTFCPSRMKFARLLLHRCGKSLFLLPRNIKTSFHFGGIKQHNASSPRFWSRPPLPAPSPPHAPHVLYPAPPFLFPSPPLSPRSLSRWRLRLPAVTAASSVLLFLITRNLGAAPAPSGADSAVCRSICGARCIPRVTRSCTPQSKAPPRVFHGTGHFFVYGILATFTAT